MLATPPLVRRLRVAHQSVFMGAAPAPYVASDRARVNGAACASALPGFDPFCNPIPAVKGNRCREHHFLCSFFFFTRNTFPSPFASMRAGFIYCKRGPSRRVGSRSSRRLIVAGDRSRAERRASPPIRVTIVAAERRSRPFIGIAEKRSSKLTARAHARKRYDAQGWNRTDHLDCSLTPIST